MREKQQESLFYHRDLDRRRKKKNHMVKTQEHAVLTYKKNTVEVWGVRKSFTLFI